VVRSDFGRLDALVNKAGDVGSIFSIGEMTSGDLHDVSEVNVYGGIRTIHAVPPLLECSVSAVIVNLSSGLRSLARNAEPGRIEVTRAYLACQTSEAPRNLLTTQHAKAYSGMRVNAA
jgi:NAD(P)-dependent dehydrogenase (short-subunit alcohol dehydrogenase family)